MKRLISLFSALCLASTATAAEPLHVEYAGGEGPGKGKHVVLIAGDEEYRSEEFMPALGRILAKHHGFKVTVLFSVDDKGFIDPTNQKSITNPAALDSADAIVTGIRFRKYPDEAMAKFDAAMKRGVPVVGLRTSTHAFNYGNKQSSSYREYNRFGKEGLSQDGGAGAAAAGGSYQDIFRNMFQQAAQQRRSQP